MGSDGRALVVQADALREPDERCGVCGGRGWHTAGGNDPMACGACPAGEVWHGVADQGWMVDDGTCDRCISGECPRCTKRDDYGWCCCGEDYQFELATTVEEGGP